MQFESDESKGESDEPKGESDKPKGKPDEPKGEQDKPKGELKYLQGHNGVGTEEKKQVAARFRSGRESAFSMVYPDC